MSGALFLTADRLAAQGDFPVEVEDLAEGEGVGAGLARGGGLHVGAGGEAVLGAAGSPPVGNLRAKAGLLQLQLLLLWQLLCLHLW